MLKGRNKTNKKANGAAGSTNGKSKENGKDNAEANNLPLFFKNPKVLNSDNHKNAGVKQDLGMKFAQKTNSIIITSAEFVEAAKFYPIVFTISDTPTPAVMVGLEQENYFVDAKGHWKDETYIPAYARQYPFVFVQAPNSDELTLCIDEAADSFAANATKSDKTMRLFEKDGKPSQFTNTALEFCAAVQKQHVYTRAFCEAVKALNLFTPQEMEAKLESGKVTRLKQLPDYRPGKIAQS